MERNKSTHSLQDTARRVAINTVHIRCIYGMCTDPIYDIFGRKIIKYTAIYGVYIRFWPTLTISKGLHAVATPRSKSKNARRPHADSCVYGA